MTKNISSIEDGQASNEKQAVECTLNKVIFKLENDELVIDFPLTVGSCWRTVQIVSHETFQ